MSTNPKPLEGLAGSAAKNLVKSAPKKSTARKSKAAAGEPLHEAYQLYVELDWVQPKVWRRLLVPVTIELSLLHVVLQLGMGWENEHLYDFIFTSAKRTPPVHLLDMLNQEYDDDEEEREVTLKESLGSRKTFAYLYDYGDSWRHKLKVEKTVKLAEPVAVAVCLEGENACPPEDIGGPYGYEQFLGALADPDDSEHEHYKEWVGGSFDPAAFDVAAVNKSFKKVAERLAGQAQRAKPAGGTGD